MINLAKMGGPGIGAGCVGSGRERQVSQAAVSRSKNADD